MNSCFRTETYYDFAGLQKGLFWQSKKKKRFHKLIRLAANERNLLLAHRNIKSNKGSKTPAVSKTTVETIKAMETQEYLTLMRLLLLDYNARWTRRLYILKRDSEELRPIGIPDYMDRDLEQVIRQVIEPIAEAKFYPFSYGFRPGRGTQQAIQKCREIINFGYFFAIEFDIQKFFDNVDFKILVKAITEEIGIRDNQLMSIIKKRLKSPILDKKYHRIIFPELGTPQGGILSPLLANIYLNKLDWWISNQYLTCDRPEEKEKARPGILIRYADDGLIFCRNMEDAQSWLDRLRKFLQDTLKIDLKDKKTRIVDLRKDTLDFLGYQLEANRRGLTIYNKAHYKSRHEGKSPTYKVKLSKISLTNKAIERIIGNIQSFIKIILALLKRNRAYSPALAKAIMDYNIYVRGIHNYYEVCTEASPNFWKIYQRCFAKFRKLYKLRDPDSARFKDKDKYNEYNKRTFSITGIPIVPIWAIKQKKIWVPPWRYTFYSTKPKINELVVKELRILSRNYIPYNSVEYNDNRLSRYSMQRGLDAVTQFFVPAHLVHCHHVRSRKDHGTDEFRNLVIVAEETHKLIHAPKPEIPDYYTEKQIKRLNKFRLKVHMNTVNTNKQTNKS